MIEARREILPMRDLELWKDGRRLGIVAKAPWRERARLTIGAETAEIVREPRFGDFLLLRNRRPTLRAIPQGAWRHEFRIDGRLNQYTLRQTTPFGIRFLFLRDSQPIGSISYSGLARAEIDLDEDLPDDLLMFVFGLTTFLQSRGYVIFLVIFVACLWLMHG